MLIQLILSILFIFFQSFAIEVKTSELSELNISLTSLNEKASKEHKFLLGQWLIGKKIKDIMSDELINKLNINPNDNVLLSFDATNQIYQLKVLRQQYEDCAYHSIKNYVWLMEILNSPLNAFGNIYFNLLSKDIYEKYQQSTGCPITGHGNPEEIVHKILNKELECIAYMPRCIPEHSESYVKNTIFFDSRIGGDVSAYFKERGFNFAKDIINNIEHTSNQKLAIDTTALYFINLHKLYDQILEFNANNSYVLGFEITVRTTMDHSVTLIVNKYQGATEYLFMDSLNSNYKTAWSGNYLAAIDTIKSFFSNINYFKDTIVRFLYTIITDLIDDFSDDTKVINILEVQLPNIKKFKLENNNLYLNIYKPKFCELIKEYKTKNPSQVARYNKLLSEINC